MTETGFERETHLSIYKAARTIKRKDNTLYNALRSIYEDSAFVGEISQLWPELPLVANLRCGLWYAPKFHSNCYFKSTDGHTNNWSFNTSRLNLHLALLAGQRGGCIIVDSTRKGKRFPDSMSKTIPIWTCVLNRCIFNHVNRIRSADGEPKDFKTFVQATEHVSADWDCSLHLPLWVSETEKANIESRLDEWTKELNECGADMASLALSLKKPLRPLWISQKTVIWLNEVPDYNSWDFTPIILVSASSTIHFQHRTTSEFSWNYIAGAGDDEESWARGLSPNIFWDRVYDIINAGPHLCNKLVAELVEKDRVYRAQRGQNAPQVVLKPLKSLSAGDVNLEVDNKTGDEECTTISWLGSTNLAVGKSEFAAENVNEVDCILSCDQASISVSLPDPEAYMHLPIMISKFDRFALSNNLPCAVSFAKLKLSQGRRLLVCCKDGEDISVCVCLAILISLYNEEGIFDDGKSLSETVITKQDMRRRLVYICKYSNSARPSRGNLKQVFGFLTAGRSSSLRS